MCRTQIQVFDYFYFIRAKIFKIPLSVLLYTKRLSYYIPSSLSSLSVSQSVTEEFYIYKNINILPV